MKFDELLEEIGEFGPYQKRIYILVSLTSVVAGYLALSPVFILVMNDYRCKLPSYTNDTYAIQNSFHESHVNITVPVVVNSQGKTAYSECYLYNVTNYDEDRSNYGQYKCDDWVYDTSVIQTSAFTDFDMVCEREILRSTSNMIDFAGALVGAVTFGPIADLIGRKKTLIVVFLINSMSCVAISQTTHFAVFAVLNFILGLTGRVMFMLAFVLGLEFIGPSMRTVAGVSILFFWTAGLFILTAAAYLFRQWRHLRLALGVPSVFIISYWWLIPESPRWLISRGRQSEAVTIIRRIAVSNGTELDESVLQQIAPDDDKNQVKVLRMFTSPALFMKTVVIWFNWFAVTTVYYGLSLNIGNLSGDIYLNFFLSSLTELASFSLTVVILKKLGRKPLHCISMVLGGLACLATIFPVIFGGNKWIVTTLALIGKFGATTAFTTIYIVSAEFFPTVVRQSAIGTCAVFEGIAGMVAPYISDLGVLVEGPMEDALPLIVFGCLTVTAGCMALVLPETRGRKLPETIEDAIKFGHVGNVHNIYQKNDIVVSLEDCSVGV